MLLKKKILISYNFILHYREEFFELLNEHFDVTVLHSGQPPADNNHSYSIIHTKVMKLGPFYLQQGLFNTYYKNQFDAVIFMLPNSKIVSEVVTKLLEINTKSILIDMSSSDLVILKNLVKPLNLRV